MVKQSMRVMAVSALALALFCGAAEARGHRQGSAGTRTVQEKLTLLGYDPGPVDGLVGKKTRDAVKAFQQDAQLKIDGVAGAHTRAAIDDMLEQGGKRPRSANNQLDIYQDALTDRLAEGSVTLPSRFGSVVLTKKTAGRYSLTINGVEISTSPAGSGLPRISRTFSLSGEDAFVLATNTPRDRNCRLTYLVFALRPDGGVTSPMPIGNCKEVLNGRIEDDRLVLSFPPKVVPSWRLEESWIYSRGTVEQK